MVGIVPRALMVTTTLSDSDKFEIRERCQATKRSLGVAACTAIVIGNMVGSGFYLSPGVARALWQSCNPRLGRDGGGR